jgi:hypothetical protein
MHGHIEDGHGWRWVMDMGGFPCTQCTGGDASGSDYAHAWPGLRMATEL